MAGRRIFVSLCMIAVGIVTAVAVSCMFEVMKMHGDSMSPAINDGSRVLVNRMAYFFDDPEPGDVVACPCSVYTEDGEGGILLRRVAAVEGDTVEVRDGDLYINGNRYAVYTENGVYLESMSGITVGKNRVFVLSDTGQAVLDSQDPAVGQLTIAELSGRVLFE